MAYKRKKYTFKDSIEYEYVYKGRYGAKGEKRAPKKKATKEQIAKQNQRNRENTLRRVIKLNFIEGDLWICIKYPKGYRPSLEQVEKDMEHFRNNVGYAYKKRGSPFKWIHRLEVGKRGGIHAHMILNRIEGADLILEQKWRAILKKCGFPEKKAAGMINYSSIYGEGDYKDLAEYIVKQPEEDSEEEKQLSLFAPVQQKRLLKISTSRNLIRPEPEEKEYKHWTMRKILDEGPEPTPGFYIDQDSIICGINPYTGTSYLYYTEYRIRGRTERGAA